jgi:pimeloyl-ACP methyl ester carboxylesterase
MIVALTAFLIVLVGSVLLVLHFGTKMLLLPHRRKPDYYREKFGFSHPSQMGLHYEEHSLKVDGGISLSYWSIDNPSCGNPTGIVVYLHGITDSKVSGLSYAKELAHFCQRIFLIDMRRHGDSEGEYCTFGYHEKRDVVALIDEIKRETPTTEITLLGVSMGAAIAIQTAAIDPRVNRVIAVAPFYDLFSIALDHQVRKIGIKSKILLKLVLKRAERVANFKSSDVSPAKVISSINVPILIVHGENDTSVKREYPAKLTELNEKARFIVVPGAGHVDVLEKGGSAYVRQLTEFMKIDRE